VFASPGETVEVDLIRGPNFTGELPEKLKMITDRGAIEADLDKKTRRAQFKLPDDLQGWAAVSWAEAKAIAYVRPKAELSVQIDPKEKRYRPRQTAQIDVFTSVAGKGSRAAVSLIGVDQSLAQLAPLPGPDALSHVRPQPAMSSAAFGALDGQALAMGRIRGANAAAATILRVSAIPPLAEIDASIRADATAPFDPVEDLTDHFYTALAEIHSQAQAWEEKAAQGEQMHPKTMAEIWQRALDACEGRKDAVTDAYGRRLRLSELPGDLLALVDPRAVVVNGTRLPEDIENWSAWVAKEKP
jgi:hypothetical protein